MPSSPRFLANPYLWCLVSAVFLAAALNRASRSASHPRWRADDPDKARTAKWTFFTLYLTLSLAAVLGALLVPGSAWVRDPLTLYFYLAATAVFFLAFRFKKSAGTATVLLAVALAVVLLLFFRSLTAFTGETEIGRVRVLAARGEQMTVELQVDDQEPAIATLDGSYFAPVVKVVIFDDAFVFIGARSWYRFEALTSFARVTADGVTSFRQQSQVVALQEAVGISERLWKLFERYDNRIPGVRTAQVEMDLKKARELTTYSLRIQNDGGLQILELR